MVIFSIRKYQSKGLAHDHGLLWSKNAPRFETFTNEKIENFIDKYFTKHQNIFKKEICNNQIHQHKRTC
jgi:hypothetical protein